MSMSFWKSKTFYVVVGCIIIILDLSRLRHCLFFPSSSYHISTFSSLYSPKYDLVKQYIKAIDVAPYVRGGHL